MRGLNLSFVMIEISGKKVYGKVALGPMAGYTSFGYRNFMIPFGVSLCYTEMISDMGLIYGNKETEMYLEFPNCPVPCGVQLFGSEPENLAKAAKIVQNLNKNVDFIDINMACPVPKVTKTGAGSALLKNPKKCGDIIRSIKSVTTLPVSAKIRLGFDRNNINFLEVISELEKAGVSFIALHARTAKDLYSGKPNFEIVRNLRQKMSVPLIISGNIFTLEDAIYALNVTGADMVMVARGGVGNPLLVKNIYCHFNGEEIELAPSFKEQKRYCLDLLAELIKEKGEEKAVRIFRSMAPSFFASLPNIKNLKKRLASEITTFDSVKNIIEEYEYDNID